MRRVSLQIDTLEMTIEILDSSFVQYQPREIKIIIQGAEEKEVIGTKIMSAQELIQFAGNMIILAGQC